MGQQKLTSWADFQLPEELLRALTDQTLTNPLPIQIRALKASLINDKHVMGAARTGSGKTLAYCLPLITRILTNRNRPCADLKRIIHNKQKRKEDFELIDGQMTAVEDMVIDKLSDFDEGDSDSDDNSNVMTSCDEEEAQSDYKQELSCPEAVILLPTRELASQVKEEVDKLCKHCNITSCCLIGGLSQDKQLRKLNKLKPDIIIATPGRLYDIVQSDLSEHLNTQSIASIRTLVIDEADRMVQRGHFEEMLKIVDIIKETKKFRTIPQFAFRVYMFSATLTFLHELPQRFHTKALESKVSRSKNAKKKTSKNNFDPKTHNKRNKIKQMLKLIGLDRSETKIIDLNDETSFGRPDPDQLMERKINCLQNEKDLNLYYFLTEHPNKRIIIFCNSKDCLRRLVNVLKFLGINCLKLFADMDQKKRLANVEKFRQNADSIMVATDVAARGLDIRDLDCVIHYQVPKTCESYIHRSGRTARLNNKGISLTLCEPKEVPSYRRLCNNINIGKDIADYNIDIDLRRTLKPRVQLAQQCDKLEHSLREEKSERNWFAKAAKECEIELDDDELRRLSGRGKSRSQNQEEDAMKRRRLAQLQKQLAELCRKTVRH